MNDDRKPRRSAGMRGSPANPAPEHGPISSVPKLRPHVPPPEPASPLRHAPSRHAKPKVLMGEVTAPPNEFAASGAKGQAIAASREALRAFMTAHRLVPTAWAHSAGVPAAPLLAFLTGKARTVPPDIAAKLAAAAKVPVAAMFQ